MCHVRLHVLLTIVDYVTEESQAIAGKLEKEVDTRKGHQR
jgi:hypothetical protein